MNDKNLTVIEGSAPPAMNPAQLMQLAVEKGHIDQLEKLMDLQVRHEEREAKRAFVEAMAKFAQNRPVIRKTRGTDYSGKSGGRVQYRFPDLGDAADLISKELGKVGVTHTWKTTQENGSVTVTCILTHAMGHSEEVTLSGSPDTSGSKNNIQAVGSTVTYLQRYTLFAATGVVPIGQDDDGASAEPVETINPDQALLIDEALQTIYNGNADLMGKFLHVNGASSSDDIPASEYKRIAADLKRLAGKAGKHVDL
jgi:hypothetical protein